MSSADSITDPDFHCECEEGMESACIGEPFYKEWQGKRYCVLHFPGQEKARDFLPVFLRKLQRGDFTFQGVWFPEPVTFFSEFTADAEFGGATFKQEVKFLEGAAFRGKANCFGETFDEKATFLSTFNEPSFFYRATFNAEAFFRTTFNAETFFIDGIFNGKAYFGSTFKDNAIFCGATFGREADFNGASFEAEVDFGSAIFRDSVIFAQRENRPPVFTEKCSLNLAFTAIEKPDHVSFHTVELRPHWFVNTDPRKFDFTNVTWNWNSIRAEIKTLKYSEVLSPHALLAIACWRLAANAEDTQRYEEASQLRYRAMNVRRKEHFWGAAFWRLSWWHWLASGYGERVLKAFLVLVGLWLFFALVFNHAGVSLEPTPMNQPRAFGSQYDRTPVPLTFSHALIYSAAVMTLQKPEPRAATLASQTAVVLESILGPVQAALLALAIRRKFMR